MVIQPIIERARWGILDAATRSWYRIMHGIEIPSANRSREAWLSMAMSKSWNSSTLRKELTAHLREHPASLPWLQSEETLQVMRLTDCLLRLPSGKWQNAMGWSRPFDRLFYGSAKKKNWNIKKQEICIWIFPRKFLLYEIFAFFFHPIFFNFSSQNYQILLRLLTCPAVHESDNESS